MASKQLVNKINRLSQFQAIGEKVGEDKKALIESVRIQQEQKIATLIPAEYLKLYLDITKETQDMILDIEAEFSDKGSAVETNIEKLKNDIKNRVIKIGESVKGEYLNVVYANGRQTWDTKGLEGYAKLYPAILDFKRVGEPSVSFRKNK